MTSARQRHNDRLQTKISQMRLTLSPIFQLPSGPPHPAYPQILLQYWLLTEQQLDSLAAYYHQLSPTNPFRQHYPAQMNWDKEFLAEPHLLMNEDEKRDCLGAEERLAIKRRMFGKFIGLRGCDTPIDEIEKRVKFLEKKVERAIIKERKMMGCKWPHSL